MLLGLTLGVGTLFKIMYSDHEEMVLIFAMIGGSILLTGIGILGLAGLAVRRFWKRSDGKTSEDSLPSD